MDKEQKLEQALALLADREAAFERACLDYADAESEYRINLSKETLSASGTDKTRAAIALTKVEKFLKARNKAEAVKEFTKEKLKDCQTAVFARQALLNADVRTNRAVG
jgi:hypothetical protein